MGLFLRFVIFVSAVGASIYWLHIEGKKNARSRDTNNNSVQRRNDRVVTEYFTTTKLNVRLAPSLNGTAIGMFDKGTKIYPEGKEGDWYKLSVYDAYGKVVTAYVHGDYVSVVQRANDEFSRQLNRSINNQNRSHRSYGGGKTYRYNVSGDADGEVYVTQSGGNGYIEDEDGNEIEVDVEWTGYGTLEATDEDGNTYDLDVD